MWNRGSVQPSKKLISATAVLSAAAMLGSGVAAAAPVKWVDCQQFLGEDASLVLDNGQTVDCGIVEVPVDYGNPHGAQTTVAFSRIKAAGQSRSTIFGNPGGPGVSALGFWVPWIPANSPSTLYDNHDLVAVQPRGLVGSNPLVCDPAQVGPYAVNTLADACYRTDPAYMRSLTTENVARDHNAVREALDVAAVDFVGQSYGTAIAADFATLFPEHTGRVVMDSAINPDWRWSQQAQQTTLAKKDRINDIFAWIAERDDYYNLGDTPLKVFHSWKWITDQEVGGSPNLTPPPAQLRDLPVELRGTGLEQPALDIINTTAPTRARLEGVARDVMLQDYTNTATTGLFDATVGATASEQAWPMLAHVLRYYNDGGEIARVDIQRAQQIRQAREGRTPALRTDTSMYETVVCNESQPADLVGIALSEIDSASGGNALDTKAAAQGAGKDCVGWPAPSRPVATDGSKLATEPLVINSVDDAITPIVGAERMHENIGGTMVTVGGGQHGAFRSGNQAVDDLVVSYLDGDAVTVDHLAGPPAPEPLPKWDMADRQAAADRGMAATGAQVVPDMASPAQALDQWYGVHDDSGVDEQGNIVVDTNTGALDAVGLGF